MEFQCPLTLGPTVKRLPSAVSRLSHVFLCISRNWALVPTPPATPPPPPGAVEGSGAGAPLAFPLDVAGAAVAAAAAMSASQDFGVVSCLGWASFACLGPNLTFHSLLFGGTTCIFFSHGIHDAIFCD